MFAQPWEVRRQYRPGDHTAAGADVVAELLLDVLEHEGVVAELAQLHDGVHERLRAALALVALLRAVRQQHALRLHVSGYKFNSILVLFILIPKRHLLDLGSTDLRLQ